MVVLRNRENEEGDLIRKNGLCFQYLAPLENTDGFEDNMVYIAQGGLKHHPFATVSLVL